MAPPPSNDWASWLPLHFGVWLPLRGLGASLFERGLLGSSCVGGLFRTSWVRDLTAEGVEPNPGPVVKLWTVVHDPTSGARGPTRVQTEDGDIIDDFREAVVHKFKLPYAADLLDVYLADPTVEASSQQAPLDVEDGVTALQKQPGQDCRPGERKASSLHVMIRTPPTAALVRGGADGGASAHRLLTPDGQKGSSAFTASGSTPEGLGLLGEVPTLLPPHVRALVATFKEDDQIVEDFLPKLQSTLVQSVVLSKVSETKSEGKGSSDFEGTATVDRDHIQALQRVWGSCYRSGDHKSKLSLAALNCEFGIATQGSCPDGCLVVASRHGEVQVVTALVEGKSTADAPLEAAGQLAASSSNAVLGQYRHGLDVDDCLVFGMATSGRLVQFYVTFLLVETFPVTAPLSCVLDLASPSGIREAAGHCAQIAKHNRVWREKLQSTSPRPSLADTMALDESKYYLKPLSTVFMVAETRSVSLAHLFRVCSRIQGLVPEAVLPLALRTPSQNQESAVVFERLDGYHMGICSADFDTFMSTLRDILQRVHDCCVVHMDLYPSNIMWKRESDGRVTVRIIDWDAAHLVGQRFGDSVRQRLDRHCAFGHPPHSHEIPDRATTFLDSYCLEVVSRLSAQQRSSIDGSLQRGDLGVLKGLLDDRFRQLAHDDRNCGTPLVGQLEGTHL